MEEKKRAAVIVLLALILVTAGVCIWLFCHLRKPEAVGGTLVYDPVYAAAAEESKPDEEAVYFWFGKEAL